ncbi:helix-turn-helix domain-containing protein [Dehalococcoidia bacterium]|nr:helix-turn-helix domain-containing protein [Dehalococcoidia bacterium]
MAIEQEWFTVDEAAEYLRLSKRTIYKLCEEGRLVGYRTGNRRHRRFRREELDRVMKRDIEGETEGLLALTSLTDPVLAEIWNNDKDAAYDRI